MSHPYIDGTIIGIMIGIYAVPSLGAGVATAVAARTVPQLSKVSTLAAFTFGVIQSGAARFAYVSTTRQHSQKEWRNLLISHAAVGAGLGCLLLASRTGSAAFTATSVGVLTFVGVLYAAAARALLPSFF